MRPSVDKVEEELDTASGSAFVVSDEGYLMICAHVVENAQKIDLKIGSKTHNGQIVILDLDHDLALIKVEAEGLQPLPLGDSVDVELGQEVRVVGYSISSVLGGKLNVTRGTVSSILSKDDASLV